MKNLDQQTQTELEAAAFRRLLQHLDENKQVQNIELMILAGFCRNCLSKWLRGAAEDKGLELDYDDIREHVYKMPYEEWKEKHQTPATEEQMRLYNERHEKK